MPEKPVQWLTDNGSAYTTHDTWKLAIDLNLDACKTAVSSSQSNGMAGRFVKTMKRDYISVMPLWLRIYPSRSVDARRVTSPVRRDAFYSQQLRLMGSGEKPLERTHFIPALRFGCPGDTHLESKYIIFNLLPVD